MSNVGKAANTINTIFSAISCSGVQLSLKPPAQLQRREIIYFLVWHNLCGTRMTSRFSKSYTPVAIDVAIDAVALWIKQRQNRKKSIRLRSLTIYHMCITLRLYLVDFRSKGMINTCLRIWHPQEQCNRYREPQLITTELSHFMYKHARQSCKSLMDWLIGCLIMEPLASTSCPIHPSAQNLPDRLPGMCEALPDSPCSRTDDLSLGKQLESVS